MPLALSYRPLLERDTLRVELDRRVCKGGWLTFCPYRSPSPSSSIQVLIKILKHFLDSPSSETSGQLLGLDLNGTLEIADAFAFPQLPQSERGADEEKERAAGRAASTSSRFAALSRLCRRNKFGLGGLGRRSWLAEIR